jgi:hypothetical protein
MPGRPRGPVAACSLLRNAFMSSTSLVDWAIAGAVVLLVFGVLLQLWLRRAAHRRAIALKQRFGSEYDFTVKRYGRFRARRTLTARLRRAEKLRLRDLSANERAEFAAAWRNTEEHFVDTPLAAVGKAQQLVAELMRVRGYPAADFEHNVANLSVHHGDIVHHYRAAHALDELARSGALTADELTSALGHWRTLFAALFTPASDDGTQSSAPPSAHRDRGPIDVHHFQMRSEPQSSQGR